MKKNLTKNIYYLSTAIIVISVGLIGGTVDILQTDIVKNTADLLGYPLYFFFLLGVFKILGALALCLPNNLSRIKEIAYIGFGFDFIFASYSHFSINDNISKIISPLILLIILLISFYLNEQLKKNLK